MRRPNSAGRAADGDKANLANSPALRGNLEARTGNLTTFPLGTSAVYIRARPGGFEEWARSDQGKKAEHGRCGLEIEAKRSDDGLRLDMPNRGRIGRVRPNDGDTTERKARHTVWRPSRAKMKRSAHAPLKVFPAPATTTGPRRRRSQCTNPGRRRKTVDTGTHRHPGHQATRTGPSRRHGSIKRQERPRSPVADLGITMHARKAPPRGGAFVIPTKVIDQAKASDAGMASASRRLADLGRLRLKIVQVGDGALRECGRAEDETLVIGQNLQPRCKVARVIGARLEVWHNAEIGAEEACAKLGD
jgi:hypothetical protein